MTLEDVFEVVAIDRMSFSLPWPERSYRYELSENPASRFLVAERPRGEDNVVVGYVGFWLIADEAHISTLAVHPHYRRLGIGRQLLSSALDDAQQLGANLCTLEVRASNLGAIDLYAEFGFVVVGRRKGYYHDNQEDAILMTLYGLQARRQEDRGGPW